MGRLNTVLVEDLINLQREVGEKWHYHIGRRYKLRIQIPEESMLYSIDEGGAHWRTIFRKETERGFGQPGRFFMLSGVHPQKDGSILLHVSMGNPRHRYHDRLSLYVRPGTVIRWRKA